MKWEYRSKVFVGVEFIVNKFEVRMFSYITHLLKTNRTICSDRKNMDFPVYRVLKTTIQFSIYMIVC